MSHSPRLAELKEASEREADAIWLEASFFSSSPPTFGAAHKRRHARTHARTHTHLEHASPDARSPSVSSYARRSAFASLFPLSLSPSAPPFPFQYPLSFSGARSLLPRAAPSFLSPLSLSLSLSLLLFLSLSLSYSSSLCPFLKFPFLPLSHRLLLNFPSLRHPLMFVPALVMAVRKVLTCRQATAKLRILPSCNTSNLSLLKIDSTGFI